MRENEQGKTLTAWVVGRDGQGVSEEGLRAHLAARLPEYMLPSRVVTLEAMPLTPNGKIDLARLPTAEPLRSGEGRRPRTPTEVRLASIWQDLLGLEHVSRDDDFFRLGGDSLKAIELCSRVERDLGIVREASAVLQLGRLRDLARHIDSEPGERDRPHATKLTDGEAAPAPALHAGARENGARGGGSRAAPWILARVFRDRASAGRGGPRPLRSPRTTWSKAACGPCGPCSRMGPTPLRASPLAACWPTTWPRVWRRPARRSSESSSSTPGRPASPTARHGWPRSRRPSRSSPESSTGLGDVRISFDLVTEGAGYLRERFGSPYRRKAGLASSRRSRARRRGAASRWPSSRNSSRGRRCRPSPHPWSSTGRPSSPAGGVFEGWTRRTAGPRWRAGAWRSWWSGPTTRGSWWIPRFRPSLRTCEGRSVSPRP